MPKYDTAFTIPPGGAHRTRFGEFILQVDRIGPDSFALRGWLPDYQEVERPLPEPAQEQPLQGEDREAPSCDCCVGTPGPLPDALPQEGEVVEGVGGKANDYLERECAFFEAVRQAVDDLCFAYCAVEAAGCVEGSLTLSNDTLQAMLVWGRDTPLRLSVSASLPGPVEEDERPF